MRMLVNIRLFKGFGVQLAYNEDDGNSLDVRISSDRSENTLERGKVDGEDKGKAQSRKKRLDGGSIQFIYCGEL